MADDRRSEAITTVAAYLLATGVHRLLEADPWEYWPELSGADFEDVCTQALLTAARLMPTPDAYDAAIEYLSAHVAGGPA